MSDIRRTSATLNSIEGKLLSAKYNLPGTITFVDFDADNKGTYKFGTAEGGMQTSNVVKKFSELPRIKACSRFRGGALVLQFNAEGVRTGSEEALLQFHASTNEADLDLPGFCPDTSGPPVNPAFLSLPDATRLSYVPLLE